MGRSVCSAITFISVNEITTIGSAFALAPFLPLRHRRGFRHEWHGLLRARQQRGECGRPGACLRVGQQGGQCQHWQLDRLCPARQCRGPQHGNQHAGGCPRLLHQLRIQPGQLRQPLLVRNVANIARNMPIQAFWRRQSFSPVLRSHFRKLPRAAPTHEHGAARSGHLVSKCFKPSYFLVASIARFSRSTLIRGSPKTAN